MGHLKGLLILTKDVIRFVDYGNFFCFLNFILSMNNDITLFLGWTGHSSTSWKVSPNTAEETTVPKQKLYDGSNHVLYWADALSEIAFVVPSQIKVLDSSSDNSFNTSSLSCQ